MILLDIDFPSLRAEQHDRVENEVTLRANLDLLDKIKDQASV